MRFAVAFSALESIAMVSSSLVVFVAVEKHLLLLELETKEEEEEEEEAFGGEEGGQKKHVAIAKFLLLALLFCPLYAQKNKRLRKVFVVILSLFVFFLCVLRSSFVQQN